MKFIQFNLKCPLKFMLAPWFVSEVRVRRNQPLVRMPDHGKYERLPGEDLLLVAVVESEHLLHSLAVAVLFSQSSIVSSPVHPSNLVVRIDVCRRACLRNLAPEYVTMWIINKPARIA